MLRGRHANVFTLSCRYGYRLLSYVPWGGITDCAIAIKSRKKRFFSISPSFAIYIFNIIIYADRDCRDTQDFLLIHSANESKLHTRRRAILTHFTAICRGLLRRANTRGRIHSDERLARVGRYEILGVRRREGGSKYPREKGCGRLANGK